MAAASEKTSATRKTRIPIAKALNSLVLISPVFLLRTTGRERNIERPMMAEKSSVSGNPSMRLLP